MSPRPRRTAHLIGQAHIDPVWLWRWSEGRAEVRATFASALERLEEYPELVFTQNQVVFLAWVIDTDPAMADRIAAHVATGRWALAGGWWVEPDTNLPLGESLVRQGLRGQRWLADHYGVRTDVALFQDSFGHPAGLPQILRGQGLTRFVFLRPGPHEKHLPAGAWRWRGPDGSSVVAHRIANEYGSGRLDIGGTVDKALAQLPVDGDVAIFYGVGNHGGGPTRENLEARRRLQGYTGMPNLLCSTLDGYFDAAGDVALPEVVGDLHRHAVGCYSAHAAMKRWMRQAERRLLAAERWATAARGAVGLVYPARALREAWDATLFNQFHDTLAGTAIEEAYVDAREQLGYAAAVAGRVTDRSLQAIAGRLRVGPAGDAQHFVVFNPVPAPVRGLAELNCVNVPAGPARVEDAATGQLLASQALPHSSTVNGWARRLLLELDVDGLGYRTVRLVPDPDGTGLSDPVRDLAPGQAAVLANDRVRLELDTGTGRPHLLAVTGGPNVLADGPHTTVAADPSDTWGHRMRGFPAGGPGFLLDRIRVLENGPVRWALRVESAHDGSRLVEDYRLTAGAGYVDVAVSLHWTEPRRVLKLRYPTAMHDLHARWECGYGSVERSTDGAEQPLHGWLTTTGTVDGSPAGLAVLTDGVCAGDVDETGPGLTVARSPLYAWHEPAPAPDDDDLHHLDIGDHTFTVRLLPFVPDQVVAVPAAVSAAAASLGDPFSVIREGAHDGTLTPAGSFASVTGGSAALTAYKAAEDPTLDATVARVFETTGAGTTARVRLGTRTVSLDLGPHQVRTLRLSADPGSDPVDTDLCEWTTEERPPVQPAPPPAADVPGLSLAHDGTVAPT